MTGFNKNTSKWLKKLSSDKKFKYKLTSCCVFPLSPLFCPSSLQYSSSIVKYTKPFQSNFRDFSPFSTRKTLPWVFSSECLQSNSQCEGTASCKCIKTGGNLGAKRTHCCGFWLDVSFFSRVKKYRSWFWLDVSLFSRVKSIVRSSDCLELISVWIYVTAYIIIEHWNFLSSESEATSSQITVTRHEGWEAYAVLTI